MSKTSSLILGAFIAVGLGLLGASLSQAILQYKAYERTVTVKGLAEKEVAANYVLWPIVIQHPDNDLNRLYKKLGKDTQAIQDYLEKLGFVADEINIQAPSIVDKLAQSYGANSAQIPFRYSASQVITVYSKQVEKARNAMTNIADLGKQGINFRQNDYDNKVEYIYTDLNKIKPDMIEIATENARLAANKFAKDSKSTLGKIKRAKQGQFSVIARDKFTPHIKKVRVVSTIEYYLAD